MSASSGVFSDFCQAWVARFPGSELPAAWEEDVRANLKKHKTKVAILREELEKEEMYVEYLNKLLVEIEEHRKKSLKLEETSLDDEDDPGMVTTPFSFSFLLQTYFQTFFWKHGDGLFSLGMNNDCF